jgi:hypothetical protein
MGELIASKEDTVTAEENKPDSGWRPMGHYRMSAKELSKLRLDEERRCGAVITRYVRGLLTCETGCKKYRDRDVAAAINIGSVYVTDVRGLPRPPAFDRTVPHAPKKKQSIRGKNEFQEYPGLTTGNARMGSDVRRSRLN